MIDDAKGRGLDLTDPKVQDLLTQMQDEQNKAGGKLSELGGRKEMDVGNRRVEELITLHPDSCPLTFNHSLGLEQKIFLISNYQIKCNQRVGATSG